jgi:hypothetical protein
MYSNLVTPEFVVGGVGERGVMGTHNFGILFYIMMMMMILFFFLTREFCESVCSVRKLANDTLHIPIPKPK